MSEADRELRVESAISTLNRLAAKLPSRVKSLEEAYDMLDKLVDKDRREKERKKKERERGESGSDEV